MQTANFTELRMNLKSYLDKVINDEDIVIINRTSEQAAVLMSLKEYNAIKETEYILNNPTVVEAIAQGERDIAEGKGVKVDINNIWK